ncbi:unnamed protein product [Closterium sp. Yama58-4]|nr:unnamed protein product [Closterium sp. Yama58-4]
MRTSGSGAGGGNSQMKLRRLLVFTCPGSETACGSLCVDKSTDINNCGACNKFCDMTEDCCGGICVDLSSSKGNCGACGARCSGQCTAGICSN